MLIERHGITWEIEGEHPISFYANGDPCVRGPVRLLSVRAPGGLFVASVANPRPGDRQGISGRNQWLSSSYDPTLRVSDGSLLLPGTSLLSCSENPAFDQTPQLVHGAVLTVVEALPEPGQEFRPAYAGPVKPPMRRLADVRNPCPQVDFPEAPAFDASKIEKVWPDFLWEWSGRYLHPRENMPDYGRDMATLVGSAAISLCVSGTGVTATLINLIQIGIDNFGCYINGGEWTAAGGHSHGRLAPILIAGLAFRDTSMLHLDTKLFAEGNQTFTVGRDPATGEINGGNGGYSPSDVGIPEWAHSHFKWPQNDNASWSDSTNPYRFCCSANAWLGQFTALRLMGLLKAANHPVMFQYLDRYVRRCKADGVPGWWIHYNQPWHLDAYELLRLPDAPGTTTFGHGRYALLADIPAQPGETFRVRIRGPYPAKLALSLGPTALMPSDAPILPPDQHLPDGITFRGKSYIESIIVSKMAEHVGNETVVDIPIPVGFQVGTTFTLQAFALLPSGIVDASNGLECEVQQPLFR